MKLVVADGALPSPARTRPPTRDPWRVGAVQVAWHPDPDTHAEQLAEGVALAAAAGAQYVCLQELTLSPYFASVDGGAAAVDAEPEDLESGPTVSLVRDLAATHGVTAPPELSEAATPVRPRRGNPARSVHPTGALRARSPHLPRPVPTHYRHGMVSPTCAAADPRVAGGPATIVLGHIFRHHAVRREGPGHGRHDQAVPQVEALEGPGLEEGFGGHGRRLLRRVRLGRPRFRYVGATLCTLVAPASGENPGPTGGGGDCPGSDRCETGS